MAALVLALWAPEVQADDIRSWTPLIAEASQRFKLPAAWIEQVMTIESQGHTVWHGRPITSVAGAMGLMQLMPATWATMRERLQLGRDPYDPHDNVMAGTCYLRLMYERFGYPGLFGAYNAGPGRYSAYLLGKRLPSETVAYIAKAGAGKAPKIAASLAQPRRNWLQGLFFQRSGLQGGSDRQGGMHALFALSGNDMISRERTAP